MDLNTFIVSVFCLIDDHLKGRHRSYRSRGPTPKLSDSEVITMEIVAEFLGIDTDKGIYTYFRRHYAHYFPKMREIPTALPSPDKQPTSGRSGRSSAGSICSSMSFLC